MPPDFKPDGSYKGIPYRFKSDGTIEALRDGAVVRSDFDHLVCEQPDRWRVPILLALTVAALCLSLIAVARYYDYLAVVGFDQARVSTAIISVLIFGIAAGALLSTANFTFGFLAGFYFFSLILGFVWLAAFSDRHYDHALATASAVLSALALLLPALYIDCPLPGAGRISERAFELTLIALTALSALIVAVGMFYHIRIAGLDDIYIYRNEIRFPIPLGYALGISFTAFLPFAFAGFVERKWRGWSVACLGIMIAFYPVTLSKIALFGPFWLVFLAALSRTFDLRVTTILSLLLPLACGLVLVPLMVVGLLQSNPVNPFFGAFNFRMVAIPSIALDLYSEFFAHHPLTWFCQISALKHVMSCPYEQPLGEVMQRAYHLGSFNASLFATEGIASVGPFAAPFVAFLCGLVIAIGNCASKGLPPRSTLLSSAIVLVVLINVPLSTTMLTYGMGLLFILWYLAPRPSNGPPKAATSDAQ